MKAAEDQKKQAFTDQSKPQPRPSAFPQSGARGSGTPLGPNSEAPAEEGDEPSQPPWDEDYDDEEEFVRGGKRRK